MAEDDHLGQTPRIKEHHGPPDRCEFVLSLIRLDGAVFRNNVLQDFPESRNVPLSLAYKEQSAFPFAWRHRKSPVERGARADHALVGSNTRKGSRMASTMA
jgi:hypothetical protein